MMRITPPLMTPAVARWVREQWHDLAERHLAMADMLFQSGYHDGAVFHAYHAFECMLCAIIASTRHYVPPEGKMPGGKQYLDGHGRPFPNKGEHDARVRIAQSLIAKNAPYRADYDALIPRKPWRNLSLYYEDDTLPYDRFPAVTADHYRTHVRQFMRAVWADISTKP